MAVCVCILVRVHVHSIITYNIDQSLFAMNKTVFKMSAMCVMNISSSVGGENNGLWSGL